MTDPFRARVTGPLEPFAAGVAAELARQGFTPNSARQQMGLVAHLSRWLAAEGLSADALGAAVVERFCEARRAAGYTNQRTARALGPLLGYLRELGVVAPEPPPRPDGPAEELLERFRRHLEIERGLVPAAADGYVEKVRPFVDELAGPDGIDLAAFNGRAVIAFVTARCPRLGRAAARLTVTALRSLLGFLHLEGELQEALADVVPSVAHPRLAGLPKRLEPAEVRALLDSCDRGTADGRRDFAILTVLARLGLRAGEVAALSFDDVDWRAGELVVRGKGRSERLPLPADVGEAIVAYLRDGRPATVDGRAVFVRVKAPHRRVTSGAVIHVVAAAARRAGLGRVGAHRLRHTAATELLRAGADLPEVGQLLRHRRLATTAIYAKVDRDALRQIARPWPQARR
jgi:site-specific recombinase XerD